LKNRLRKCQIPISKQSCMVKNWFGISRTRGG